MTGAVIDIPAFLHAGWPSRQHLKQCFQVMCQEPPVWQIIDMPIKTGGGTNPQARVQIRSATLINRLGGRGAIASEPLDHQVKVANNGAKIGWCEDRNAEAA